MAALAPFLPLAERLGRLAMGLAQGSSVERIEASFLGRIADLDTRLLTLAVITGAMQGRTEQAVNHVNAASLAAERGIVVEERSSTRGRGLQRADPRRPSSPAASASRSPARASARATCPTSRRSGTTASWSSSSDHVSVFRYRDVPGMIGPRRHRVRRATAINISSAAVGRQPDGGSGGDGLAAMVVMTDEPVPDAVVAEVLASAEFVSGRSVTVAMTEQGPLAPAPARRRRGARPRRRCARRRRRAAGARGSARRDPFWPAQLTVLAAIALSLDLPSTLDDPARSG